jgi:hypothetical protein
MAVTDVQLIAWMKHQDPRVRGASLDLVTSSYASDPSILQAVFEAWDLYGPEYAFHDFPLISHLPIPADRVEESLRRASEMSSGRKITDRACRCAGKLVEAISVADATVFAEHLAAIAELKQSSKIFFRIPLVSMSERALALQRQSASLKMDFQDGQPNDISIALECLNGRGEADFFLARAFEQWAANTERTPLAMAVLELASRHPIVGYEAELLELMNAEEASVADLATIALVRARSPVTQTRIADRFPHWGRSGQLRAIDVVRRMRLPQSSNLLRFLLPYGREVLVQDAARMAEVLVFDFAALEDWLEALLLVDEASLRRLMFAMPLAQVLAESTVPEEWPRIQHLMEMRLGPSLSAGPTTSSQGS